MKNDFNFTQQKIEKIFKDNVNQIYKLLPIREEGGAWEPLLYTIIEELEGVNTYFDLRESEKLLHLVLKLYGLLKFKEITDNSQKEHENFLIYRRTIFDCINLTKAISQDIIEELFKEV